MCEYNWKVFQLDQACCFVIGTKPGSKQPLHWLPTEVLLNNQKSFRISVLTNKPWILIWVVINYIKALINEQKSQLEARALRFWVNALIRGKVDHMEREQCLLMGTEKQLSLHKHSVPTPSWILSYKPSRTRTILTWLCFQNENNYN